MANNTPVIRRILYYVRCAALITASEEELRAAAERLRFQRGQSDRILAGLSKYARWKAKLAASGAVPNRPPR